MRPALPRHPLRRSALVCALAAVTACTRPAPDVLATYRDGELRLADLDAFIRSLPEARRAAPAASRETWLEDQLRALAAERLLEASSAVAEHLASPEIELRRRWATVNLLSGEVTAQLAGAVEIAEGAVAERVASRGDGGEEGGELLSFRHVFLRLDRAGDAAERLAIEERGREIARRARAGEDFAELARQHSESKDAADGGLVENQRPALLEATARQALEALEEGELSPLVATRTGLHLFRLERRLATPRVNREPREGPARRQLAREAAAAARRALIGELSREIDVETGAFPWRVGGWQLTEDELEGILATLANPGAAGGARRQWLVEQLLLAEEGRRRGLLTPELEQRVEVPLRQEARQTAYRQRLDALVAALPAERVRSLYDARPSGFATQELAHLELIFVRHGRDAFATQRQLEDRVAELRAGESFAELAREISTGPEAAGGGDLGLLPPSEWARLNPEIYGAVVALEAGEVSDPISCTARILSRDPRTLRGGFAIVRVREKQPPRQRSFEEALDDARAVYAQQNAAELALEVRDALLAEADFKLVRVPDPAELAK